MKALAYVWSLPRRLAICVLLGFAGVTSAMARWCMDPEETAYLRLQLLSRLLDHHDVHVALGRLYGPIFLRVVIRDAFEKEHHRGGWAVLGVLTARAQLTTEEVAAMALRGQRAAERGTADAS